MNQTKFARIQQFIAEQKLPSYRFDQITHAVFAQRIAEFEQMTTLSLPVRTQLQRTFGNTLLSIQPIVQTDSAQTTKVLFQIAHGQRVEAVRMKYRAGWESFCISSQAGCGLACRFCATGAIGLKRNLTADEITDQVLYFHFRGHKLDSLSFMGMGEPLANPETFSALQTLTDPRLFHLSQRRITVSTVGMIPGIQRMTAEFPHVNLVFSLHSPFDQQRSELVPLNQRYPIHEIMPVLDEHVQRTNRQVSIAYLLLKGVNDTPAHADGIIALLKERKPWNHLYHVNVIRYHPAKGAPHAYSAPTEGAVEQFVCHLQQAGLNVTRRSSFGRDIDAACGQLYGRYETANGDR